MNTLIQKAGYVMIYQYMLVLFQISNDLYKTGRL